MNAPADRSTEGREDLNQSRDARPEFITNQDGNTLLAALQAVIPDAPAMLAHGMAETPLALTEISIATAFMSPAGFGAVTERLDQAGRVRLLIGAEPEPEAKRPQRKPGDPPQAAFERREVAEGLKLLEAGLRRERDRQPFSAEAGRHLRGMVRMLRAGKLETRRYERAFLHAKAMLLDGLAPGLIAGSSNLTRAGLTTNLELNLGRWDPALFTQAKAWFDALWDEAVPFDLAGIFEEPDQEFPPWLIFLRILWQLYGEELEQEREEEGDIPLTAFQLHGVWRARRILKDYGGVIVADEVGLGKTFIAGEILNACAKNRQRALLVCPAALRDSTWRRFLDAHGISRLVEMVSYDELSRDRQFHDERRPLAVQNVLSQPIEDYALVVVDEAHNYRNPDAPYRAAVLRRLLFGQRKDLVLLTATPVNNSLWDLFHLLRFFLRQDSALAAQGVVSVQERFKAAAKQDPANLSPDFLYPIIDAITVKRTRGFVKKHYAGDTIRGPDGVMRPIVFPKAVPISVRYDLEKLAPGLFDAVVDALDPAHGNGVISFSRYAPGAFLLQQDEEEAESNETASGLLRSGLLKRFESSAHAFHLSLTRMVREHDQFLDALGKGKVIATAFLGELSADDEGFDDLLDSSTHVADAIDYDAKHLREAVERDRAILQDLASRLGAVQEEDDPKLAAVVEELARIAAEARSDAATDAEEQRNRKVLLFSYFGDTVAWLRQALEARVATDPRLAGYRHRIVGVVGGGLDGEEANRNQAVWGFAPESSDPPPGQEDLFDLLITTDVLAEGMNLQQARHIINYDLPWNPMRLVQRHGRIDRIGSPHPRVFLRTVFPADRLDALLALEARILRKLTQAAKSIGVATLPLDGAEVGDQVFAETRSEIEKLALEDPTLFEQGGTASAAQTGEEYRQRLRTALQSDRKAITELPGRVGSGMRKGRVSGVLFCAEVPLAEGRRTFLRFVPAQPGWLPSVVPTAILRETGTCLRLIDCTEETPREMPAALGEGIFGFWDMALGDILAEWDDLSDPANLQPSVRLLNRQVAVFIRTHPPHDMDADRLAKALDVLEAPWPRREEALLREQFRDRSGVAAARSLRLVEWILGTGLERFEPPAPLPPISNEDVRLVCWMAVEAEKED
ncbi:helicase-related protein [Plastoroseomonas hellenica]|uniref:helicase-related protein n=1 Tax=Plastoroseomonas hellenica TaxID=2687306 RepID=UPI001BADF4E1|nr:helicase-related protein [Plastoroseomonas hellenica]MBR0645349.1 helicase [Plastoroseomonas hellenica]